jgi:Glycosyl transferase family 2
MFMVGSEWLKRLLYSRWGVPLRPVHRALVNALLLGVGAVDGVRFRGRPDPRLAELATIAVKTFERPEALLRYVRTARRVFGGRIVVADDSRRPWASKDPRVDVLAMPYNSGVSVGRNAALDAVSTPYVIVSEDDFVYTRATDWTRALEYLERNPDVDAVAGIQVELPRWYTKIFDGDPLFAGHAPALREPDEVIDGLPVWLMTPQAYLARTDSVRRVRWNEDIRMVDHRDFFSRAAGVLVFVQDATIPVFHARTPWNAEYTKHRDDVSTDLAYLGRRWPVPGAAD